MGESDNMTDKKPEEVGDNFSDHSSSQTVVFEDISQNSGKQIIFANLDVTIF